MARSNNLADIFTHDSISSLVDDDVISIKSIYDPHKSKHQNKSKRRHYPSTLPQLMALESPITPSVEHISPTSKENIDIVFNTPYSNSECNSIKTILKSSKSNNLPCVTPVKVKLNDRLKPFRCSNLGCDKSCSMAFDLVIHERTCVFAENSPAASKQYKGLKKVPVEFRCIPIASWNERVFFD